MGYVEWQKRCIEQSNADILCCQSGIFNRFCFVESDREICMWFSHLPIECENEPMVHVCIFFFLFIVNVWQKVFLWPPLNPPLCLCTFLVQRYFVTLWWKNKLMQVYSLSQRSNSFSQHGNMGRFYTALPSHCVWIGEVSLNWYFCLISFSWHGEITVK